MVDTRERRGLLPSWLSVSSLSRAAVKGGGGFGSGTILQSEGGREAGDERTSISLLSWLVGSGASARRKSSLLKKECQLERRGEGAEDGEDGGKRRRRRGGGGKQTKRKALVRRGGEGERGRRN